VIPTTIIGAFEKRWRDLVIDLNGGERLISAMWMRRSQGHVFDDRLDFSRAHGRAISIP
jgi:hypothetical protein